MARSHLPAQRAPGYFEIFKVSLFRFLRFPVYNGVRTLRNQGGTTVDDSGIIELYFRRAESAIEETARKYGTYLNSVAYLILERHHRHQPREEHHRDGRGIQLSGT